MFAGVAPLSRPRLVAVVVVRIASAPPDREHPYGHQRFETLAVFGLAFHAIFVAATDWSYDSVFPAMGNASWVGSVRWALAGALILPQAIVLGTTFPLMAAGLALTQRG